MFQFNFDVSDCEVQPDSSENNSKTSVVTKKIVAFSRVHQLTLHHKKVAEECRCSSISIYGTTYLLADVISANSTSADAAAAENSDLIPNVYEGGRTVWECSHDLVGFLCKNRAIVKDANVLELGCGAGIPSICALSLDAEHVTLQDYNDDVIDSFSIPTLLLNLNKQRLDQLPSTADKDAESSSKFLTDDTSRAVSLNFSSSSAHSSLQRSRKPLDLSDDLIEASKRCKCVSGDWSQMSAVLEKSSYDVVLAAETIYSVENYSSLCDAMDFALKANGKILIAAKSHYFGVGGGMQDFVEFLERDARFRSSSVWSTDTGLSREILLLTRSHSART